MAPAKSRIVISNGVLLVLHLFLSLGQTEANGGLIRSDTGLASTIAPADVGLQISLRFLTHYQPITTSKNRSRRYKTWPVV